MRENFPPKRWQLDRTWKISISSVAVHVYKSPAGEWIVDFGVAYPHEFGTKTTALKKARQLAGKYGYRVLTEQ